MSALAVTRVEAQEPPEVRGSGRDDVALLVATRSDGALTHARFRDLPRFLDAGDLLVVNNSAALRNTAARSSHAQFAQSFAASWEAWIASSMLLSLARCQRART